jgi:hypothetical protein
MFPLGTAHCGWQLLLADLDKQDHCTPESQSQLAELSAYHWGMESCSLNQTGKHREGRKHRWRCRSCLAWANSICRPGMLRMLLLHRHFGQEDTLLAGQCRLSRIPDRLGKPEEL